MNPRPRVWPWSLAAGLLTFVTLAWAIQDLGETWDEPVYEAAAQKAAGWFGQLAAGRDAFSKPALHEGWVYGRFGIVFHPPGAGYPAMLMHAVLGGTVSTLTAYRLANALEFSLAVGLLCGFVGAHAGRFAGVMAAAALVTMPRAIGDALLFTTDVPSMLWWVVTAICYLRGVERPTPGRQALFAAALGYGFLVKPTAVLVILPLAVWSLLRLVQRARTEPAQQSLAEAGRAAALGTGIAWPLVIAAGVMWFMHGGMRAHAEQKIAAQIGAKSQWSYPEKEARLQVERLKWLMYVDLLEPGVADPAGGALLLLLPAGLWLLRQWRLRSAAASAWLRPVGPELELALAATAIAPAVVYLLGPCWWRDPLLRLAHYMALNFQRQGALPDIEILYFGQKYLYTLPWHNAYVLLAIVTPLGTLALFATGLWGAIARWRANGADTWGLFLLVQFLTLPVLRMVGVPAHDGVRLMQPTLWFMAALAGLGAGWLVARLAGAKRERKATVDSPADPRRGYLTAAGCVVVMLAALVNLVRSHPHELSYHNQLIGGLPGAWRAGCEVTYWYDAVNRPALERIREALPEGAVLLHHQHVDVFVDWERDVLGPKVHTTLPGTPETRWVGLLTHGSKSNPTTRLLFAMRPHLVAAEYDGVPLYSVYTPQAIARATALTLLTRADREMPGEPGPVMQPARVHDRIWDLVERRPESLRAAAVWLAEELGTGKQGEPTAETQRRREGKPPKLSDAPAVAQVALKALLGDELQNWRLWQASVGPYASTFPQTLPEAMEILITSPERVREVIEAAGYLPSEEYLDEAAGG